MASNFQNLDLPVIRDAQDYPRLVPAGETVQIPVIGEFVYCKFSDGEIRVVINGKSTNMESGDERRSGDGTVFEGVNLINDTAVDKAVIFVIGFGKFDRKIIQGNVSIEPVLRNADGTTKPDTRYNLDLSLQPLSTSITAQNSGDLVDQAISDQLGGSPSDQLLAFGPGGTLYSFSTANNVNYLTTIYDIDTMQYIGVATGARLAFRPGGEIGVIYNPVDGRWYFVDDDGIFYRLTFDGAVTGPVSYSSIGQKRFQSQTDMVSARGVQYNDTLQEIYLYGLNSSNQLVIAAMNADFTLKYFVTIPGRTGNNGTYIFDDFNQVHTVSISDFAGGMDLYEYDLNGDFIRQLNIPVSWSMDDNLQQVVRYRFYIYRISSFNPQKVEKRVYEDFTPAAEIAAVKPGCEFRSILTDYQTPAITANIIATQTLRGVEVTGEVIKAALEYYFRRAMPADYLDHVYYFDSNTEAFDTSGSGNRTFLAAGIADNYTVQLPGRLIITLDQELQLGAQL